ncbi:MAG: ClbS/DfsB family four-helix bundle protein [Bacteroidota bacterium]
MPKPKTKAELLIASQQNMERLLTFIQALPPNERKQEFPLGTLNRNIRDVLAHLHHWHLLMMNWYETGERGEKPEIPAPGYTWRTTPELNKEIQQKYIDVPLEKVQILLGESHQALQTLMGEHSEEELFEKKRYKWTGSTSLGAYLISATSSHYDWAYKLIRKSINKRK